MEVYRNLGQDSRSSLTLLKEKPPKRIHVVRVEIDEHSSNYQTGERVA